MLTVLSFASLCALYDVQPVDFSPAIVLICPYLYTE